MTFPVEQRMGAAAVVVPLRTLVPSWRSEAITATTVLLILWVLYFIVWFSCSIHSSVVVSWKVRTLEVPSRDRNGFDCEDDNNKTTTVATASVPLPRPPYQQGAVRRPRAASPFWGRHCFLAPGG